MKGKVVATVAAVLSSLFSFTTAANAQTEIPSFGLPRDGYIHMTYRQFENSFNANAASRGLPFRLVEKPQPGTGHEMACTARHS